MTYKYTEADAQEVRPNALPIAGTDVEISVGQQGEDVMLWVNKAGIQVLRARLKDAAKDMTAQTLMQFSSLGPDFVFTIGDSADGLARVKRSLGLVE